MTPAPAGTGPAPLERSPSEAPFTSDLSIDEAILLEEIGFDPIEFVMGSSFYHIGYQLGRWSKNEEMGVLTRAMVDARNVALGRLTMQAHHRGADGIVGVRMQVDHHGHHAEFLAMGTAVKARAGDWRIGGYPFVSDLSGQDFWALVRAGFRPHRLVMGCCVYHVAHQGLGQWISRIGNNCEMPNYTQALYDARELAMERMQAEAQATGARGVVGVHIEEGSHGWHPHVIEFLALGTSIGPSGGAHEHEPIAAVLSTNK
jgi:uncharacterized protein YbjQ (UPF0145 family)